MTAAEQPLTHRTPSESAEADWPQTTRILPWVVAGLVVFLFIVPVDSITLPISLPVDARPDRIALFGCFVIWALVVAVRPASAERSGHKFGWMDIAICLFVGVAIASVALNLSTLEALDEVSGAVKRLALLLAYVAFYFFVAATLRPTEIARFIRLVVIVGTIAAVGALIESTVRFNVFFWLAHLIAPPGSSIDSEANILTPGGRPDITGPARHGLALSTMLAMILPFAVVGSSFADLQRDRWLYRVAALLLFVGCLATLRRSGVILPFIATSAVVAFGGRRMRPVAVAFVVLLALTPIVAPSAVRDIRDQFSSSNTAAQQSVAARLQDYPAIMPDFRANALFGRGFGTYTGQRYRVLDNQYLGALVGIGGIGTALYLLMMISAAAMGLRLGFSRHGTTSWIGLAGGGAAIAFIVANALFDTLAFPQAPYAFFLIVALVAVARRAPDRDR